MTTVTDAEAGSARRSDRRWPRAVIWTVVLAVAAAAALAWSAPMWIGHNGDHAYYTAMTLQYGGEEYDRSLRRVAQYFAYPDWSRTLDFGFLNPSVAPLIYPRPVYPLLGAWPVQVFGLKAMYLPGLAAGVISVLAIGALILRRTRSAAGLLVIPLLLSTYLFTEFGFGIYIDALVIALVGLIMLYLPWRGPTGWWHVTAVAALVVIMLLSRQVPLVPLGMIGGGWLWAAIGTRRLFNDWFRYLAVVVPVTVLGYLLLGRWAPYDPFPFLKGKTGADTTLGAIAGVPGLLDRVFEIDGAWVLHHDIFVLPLFGLTLIGLWLCRRSTLAGVFTGLFLASFATLALNGVNGEWRYLTPAIPAAALLCAEVVVRCERALRRRVAAAEQPAEPLASERTSTLVRATAVASVAAVAAVLVGTVIVSRPAPLDGAPTAQIASTDYDQWPLTVDNGTLSCAGDDRQIWFTSPDGTRYALSGTAMAKSFLAPRITELADGEIPYGWAAIRPLLDTGIELCLARTG